MSTNNSFTLKLQTKNPMASFIVLDAVWSLGASEVQVQASQDHIFAKFKLKSDFSGEIRQKLRTEIPGQLTICDELAKIETRGFIPFSNPVPEHFDQ